MIIKVVCLYPEIQAFIQICLKFVSKIKTFGQRLVIYL